MHSKKAPTRVLYCESNMDGTIGGSHYCLFYLVEGLDRRRFEPIVVFYQDNAIVPRFRAAGVDTRVLEPPKPFRPSILRGRMAKLPLVGALLRAGARAINFVGFVRQILNYRRFLRREQIALVHLNNSILRHHEWMWAALMSGTPCLTHERGINKRYPWLSRYLGRRLKTVISMSKAIRDLMVERGVSGDNIRVMYDGLEPARLEVRRAADDVRQQFNIEADQPVIGMVGNIRRWKGQEVLVRAMSAVRAKYPRVVCLIVGDTAQVDKPYEVHLRDLVRQIDLTDTVRFTGYQANVQDFLNVMDVVVHASIEPEPFGMVVLEAMARRKPVVGSRAGGVPEMVVEGETGYTFPPGDSNELAGRLIELLDDPARATLMGERGHERVLKHFSVRSYIRDVEELYGGILGTSAAPSPVPAPALGK